MKRKEANPVFKPYVMGQPSLLPPDLEELIPEEHLVRVVNRTIEEIDLSVLLARYKGGGTSSYHPEMMLKVLVYAYTQRVYTSRKMAKALRENVYFMWISGQNRPDFRTINRFRGEVMKGIIQEVFGAVLELLIEAGYVRLEDYFVDGTTMEANARRHSYVWAKNTKRYKEQLQKKVRELLEEIERVDEEEDEQYGDRDLEEMGEEAEVDAEKIKEKIEELNERLKKKPEDQQLKKAVKTLEREYLPRQEKYEGQERLLAGRNSYSKTDPDATFMRMKEDRSNQEARPKSGYNVQTGTEGQFVVGFSVHRRPGDTSCFKPHMENLKQRLPHLPENIVGDAGYGSEENYMYLEQEKLACYLKYNTFHKEQTRKYREDRFRAEHFPYDPEKNVFRCPGDQPLTYRYSKEYTTENGYTGHYDVYECIDCSTCVLKPDCTRAKGNRQIRVNWNLRRLRDQARENLMSKEGVKLRSRRGPEVESVFGHIKHNMGFRRFILRGLEKVTTEWGILCLAHNMKKLAAIS
ncbi:IS1182 family transposase [Candidatus Bathyarchaeota archaeon]|nr:MAG: IS1182 family transposase [Candidatus Bathyarchaeota archaeon]